MKTLIKPSLTLAGLAAAMFVPSVRADFYQAPYGPGGTWRIYETPRSGLTFKDALAAARASTDPLIGAYPGNLVSVTSLGKNTFLYRSVGKVPGDSWIGLTDREGVADGSFESQGEPDNRATGWAWTNDDIYTFNNWGGGEPNDSGGEDAAHFRGDALWNDHKSGFGVDDPVPASIKPGSSTDETAAPLMGFMVEYPINSPTPLPGIRFGRVFPPCARFNLPLNTTGNWSVREIRGLTLAGNVYDSMDKAINNAGDGSIFEGQFPYLDFTDPDTNAAGGPFLTTAPRPFQSNGFGGATDDDNIISVATTRIHIDPAKAGIYTIQVHGDDGFAMRIKGVPWITVAGGTDLNRGYIDPLDPTALIFERGTGDANTMATINLAAGDYDVEFLNWEGGGGAYYEVSATSADAIASGFVQWQPFGSSTDLPGTNTLNTVRLAAPATVKNANLHNRANSLPAMRYYINHIDGATAVKQLLQLGEGDMPNNNGGDNYITKVTGQFMVAADANGNLIPAEVIPVTFRLNCDDGASMRIIGQDFLAVNPGGENGADRSLIDNGGDMTLTADFPTGNTNCRGLINLTEGTVYNFECYMYEYGGGSNFNLFWQLGDFVASDLSAPTGLGTAAGPIALVGMPDPVNFPGQIGALVENTALPGTQFTAPFLPAARAIIADAAAQNVTYNGTTSIVVLRDDATIGLPGNSLFASSVVMPIGLDQDNYITRVSGQIIVDDQDGTPGELLTLTFGLFADDGADLHIIGQSFTSASGGGTLQVNGADTWLVADFFTGNTDAYGVITLTEGVYDFESYHYEGGGGSGLEIFWANGSFTTFGSDFKPLNDQAGTFLAPGYGIPLVAGLDLDGDDDGIPGAWELANGLSDSNAADAALDNDGDGNSNLQEYLAGTNPNSAASRFDFTSVASGSGNVQITLPGQANYYYQLFASTNLQAPWTEVGRALPSTSGPVVWNIPTAVFPGSKLFFRAEVMPCE